MDFYKLVMLIFAILFVVIQGLIVNYLIKLESIGCDCAMDWRRNYIVFYLILSIIYALSAFFLDRDSIPLIQTLMVVFGLINFVVTLQYVHKLKKEKCECSESLYREIMMFVAIFNAIVYSSLLVLIIFLLFTMASYAKSAQGKISKGRKSISIRPIKKLIKRGKPTK